jgi:hypothetical protein
VSKKTVIIDSDSDAGDESTKSKQSDAHSSTSRKARVSRAKPPPSSDDGDYSAGETPSETGSEESFLTSGDEAKKSGSKPSVKPKVAKRPPSSENTSDVSMDVDKLETKPGAKKDSKKRKADDEKDGPAKKQKRRDDTDPWKLETRSVQRDWTQMQALRWKCFILLVRL